MLRSVTVLMVCGVLASLVPLASGETLSGPAPNFTLDSRDGGKVSLADFKGQVVMINFWATWCGPCRQEMPKLEAIHQRFGKLGFTLLGVNVEDNPDGAKKFLKETPVTFPILFDPKSVATKLYHVETMPSSVLIGRDGTMRFVYHGYQAGYENDYQDKIRSLLLE
jgi:peroxiredoxin